MRNMIYSFVALVLASGFIAPDAVQADVIQGPSMSADGNIGKGNSWGLQFTANQDTYLTGFQFSHYSQSYSGTISLIDVTKSNTVDSWSVSSTPLTYFFHATDPLTSGDKYQLIYAQKSGDFSDEKFAYLGTGVNPEFLTGTTYNYSNSDITMTNGVEDGHLSNPSGYAQWFAFNNLVTSQTIPEPWSISLLGLGGICLAIGAIRRRRQIAPN